MSAEPLPLEGLLGEGDAKACCASIYESPAVDWLLDGQLHPGGETLSRRAAELAGIERGQRVLDVASGRGDTARLLGRDLGAEVVGVELGASAVDRARVGAKQAGLADRVSFIQGDAETLPFDAPRFDAVVCECSLCLFPDKLTAIHEMARVLVPGGAVVIADVTADQHPLPAPLRTAAAQVACVADALPADGYRRLLETARLEVVAMEPHDDDLATMIDRVEARLRVARMLRASALAPYLEQLGPALELIRLAKHAVAAGHLGYSVMVARKAP